ncbi:MAG: hypothetical protein AAF614_31660 [Chloroflexota bacterium]
MLNKATKRPKSIGWKLLLLLLLVSIGIATLLRERPTIAIITYPPQINFLLEKTVSRDFYSRRTLKPQVSYLFWRNISDAECGYTSTAPHYASNSAGFWGGYNSHFSYPENVAMIFDGIEEDPCRFNRVTFVPVDLANGEKLYQSMGCDGCHGNLDAPDSAPVGPWLGNIAQTGTTRRQDMSAPQYIYESILEPNAFIATECPNKLCSSPSAMPGNYGARFGYYAQDIADLLAYLLKNTIE